MATASVAFSFSTYSSMWEWCWVSLLSLAFRFRSSRTEVPPYGVSPFSYLSSWEWTQKEMWSGNKCETTIAWRVEREVWSEKSEVWSEIALALALAFPSRRHRFTLHTSRFTLHTPLFSLPSPPLGEVGWGLTLHVSLPQPTVFPWIMRFGIHVLAFLA